MSGFLWHGNESKLLSAATEGRIVLFSSPALYDEFSRVLSYERLAPFVSDKTKILEKFRGLAVFVLPKECVAIIKDDPADDRVLECALAADVNLIVSGDNHLLKLRTFRSIPILTTQEALAKI